jgi:hypothetical protein
MGYAQSRADLRLGPELTELETGDIAQRDRDGFYTIVGRKKRFVKIFGLRVSLDEVEKKLAELGSRAVATGADGALLIGTLDVGSAEHLRHLISAWTRLPASSIRVVELDDYPVLPSGKIDYQRLQESVLGDDASEKSIGPGSIAKLFQQATGAVVVSPEHSFVSLGGDSLSYVSVSVSLEKMLGYVPRGWENVMISELEALQPSSGIFCDVDTSIALRAFSILGIAFSHMGGFDALKLSYPGGLSGVLFIVCGFNFAKFQLSNASVTGAQPVLRAAARIAISTLAFLLPLELLMGKFSWPTILMYSNLVQSNLNSGVAVWFIEVLLQMLVLLALFFSFPWARKMARRSPYATFLSLLALSTGAFLLGPYVWDTTPLFDRTPHMLMYTFVFGCCVFLGQSLGLKVFNSALLVIFVAADGPDMSWLTLIGGLLLIWASRVWAVWPLNRAIAAIGGASLFIYLSHLSFARLVYKVLGTDSLMICMPTAAMGGVLLWMASEKAFGIVSAVFESLWTRRLAQLRPPTPSDPTGLAR